METRIQYIFLGLRNAALVALLALTQTNLMAAEQETVEWDEAAELVEPEIKRTKVDIANIDALDVEMGAFFGMMNVVDFGTNPVSGISLAYHVTEDIFVILGDKRYNGKLRIGIQNVK